MKNIRIVSDSSSDVMSLEYADFAYSPMKIIAGETQFTDDSTLDVAAMAEFFDKYKGRSSTSCPNPTDWLTAFGDAEQVICVTITSALSGSYNSACTAKQLYEAEHPDRHVFVLDTLSAGPQITLVVKKLEEYVKNKMPFDEICQNIKEYLKNTGLVFMLKSLKNFANNGRVSPIVAKIVGIAGICIVGRASDEGTLEPTHKCRGENHSLNTLLCDLEKYGLRSGKVSIGHCSNESAALDIKKRIEEKFSRVKVEIHKLRGLCSFYAEKGGMLVGFEKC